MELHARQTAHRVRSLASRRPLAHDPRGWARLAQEVRRLRDLDATHEVPAPYPSSEQASVHSDGFVAAAARFGIDLTPAGMAAERTRRLRLVRGTD